MEMDALKKFEQLLMDESKPMRPMEEGVLDYLRVLGSVWISAQQAVKSLSTKWIASVKAYPDKNILQFWWIVLVLVDCSTD
jgi:hypothetical protein